MPFVPTSVLVTGTQDAKPAVVLLVELALKLGKLDELASEIETARKKLPAWTAGDALLALVLCRAGTLSTRLKRWSESFPRRSKRTRSRRPVPNLFYAYSAIAQELEQNAASRELATRVYENALSTPYSFLQFRFERSQTPLGRLVDLYRREGRIEDARRSLLNLVRDLQFPDGYREELANAYKMQALDCVARELIGLGFAADAVPLLSEAVNLAEVIDPNSPLPAVATLDVIQSPDQIRQHLNAAIEGMNPPELAPLAGRLIAETIEAPNMNKDASRSKQAKPRDQALDLVLMIYPRELDKATVRSLLAESIGSLRCQAARRAR